MGGKKQYISDDVKRDFTRLAQKTEPTQGGVVLGIPTGDYLEDDPTYIEVLISGKSYFVKPCYSFAGWSIPNKEWLEKYKDEIGVWVAFENGNPAHGVYLGVCPLDFNSPQDFYLNGFGGKSVHFKYAIDDEDEQAFVKHENGFEARVTKEDAQLKSGNGDSVTVTDGEIKVESQQGHTVVVGKDGILVKNQNQRQLKINNSVILGLGAGAFSVTKAEVLQGLLTSALNAIANDVLIVAGTTATHSPAAKAAIQTVVNSLKTIGSDIVKTD